MRAADLYRLMTATWREMFEQAGVRRVPKTKADWYQVRDGRNLLLAVQASDQGWDRFHGSDFVIEFDVAKDLKFGRSYDCRGRFGEHLDTPSLERIRAYQNEVVRRMQPPTPAEAGFDATDPDYGRYLAAFFSAETEMRAHDLHFRYYDDVDAAGWLELLGPMLLPELERHYSSLGPGC